MIFWQLNTRTPQTAITLRMELEAVRDHFIRTQHPDTVVQQMNATLAGSSGSAAGLIKTALDSYLAAKPSGDQMERAVSQMNGAISAAQAMVESMTLGLEDALVRVTLHGHVDEGREDGVDQRSGLAVDFAPMPRMQRARKSPEVKSEPKFEISAMKKPK